MITNEFNIVKLLNKNEENYYRVGYGFRIRNNGEYTVKRELRELEKKITFAV